MSQSPSMSISTAEPACNAGGVVMSGGGGPPAANSAAGGFTPSNHPTVAFRHAGNASAAHGTNNTNNPRRTSKRRGSSDGHRVATGRSFKRLRLDHVHCPAGTGGAFSSAQSTGTLSVGTFGGDLESNDEDLGDDDDDETEDGAATNPGESVASSWVASLGSGGMHRKRRMPGGPPMGLPPMGSGNFAPGGMGAQPMFASYAAGAHQFQSSQEEDDDAATCSGRTTAAVAPRRRRLRRDGKRTAIERIPDPLLVAAQHAAGPGGSPPPGPGVQFDTTALKGPAIAAAAADCCSSVTEEEQSLGNDEASISAISIGANTAISALSGGMEGSLPPPGDAAGSFDQIDRQNSLMSASRHMSNPSPGAAMKSNAPSDYAPLNTILGGLHKERLTRLSANRPLSRGESSLHSMGSEGALSGGGGSHRSLPGNIRTAGVSVAWNPMHGGQPQPPVGPRPPPFVQQQSQPPLSMDEDAEMEEADEAGDPKLGPAGGFPGGGGSAASLHGNGSCSSGAASHAAVASGGSKGPEASSVPKWKRPVDLPSHTNLY